MHFVKVHQTFRVVRRKMRAAESDSRWFANRIFLSVKRISNLKHWLKWYLIPAFEIYWEMYIHCNISVNASAWEQVEAVLQLMDRIIFTAHLDLKAGNKKVLLHLFSDTFYLLPYILIIPFTIDWMILCKWSWVIIVTGIFQWPLLKIANWIGTIWLPSCSSFKIPHSSWPGSDTSDLP